MKQAQEGTTTVLLLELIGKNTMRAKKSLGQNFLNSKAVVRDILLAANLNKEDTVLEIGPGKGVLTEELLKSSAKVIAVEKDDRMIPLLTERFSGELRQGNFILIHADIIELLEKDNLQIPAKYKLVANIPYYITGYLLRAFLERTAKPEQMVLMLQKEVADRIVARDKKESILSLSVKAYGTPKLIKKVSARYFTPAPKVDSAILSIERISSNNFKNSTEEKFFFEVLKSGFAHKRKQLLGNLKETYGEDTAKILIKNNLPLKIRAEDLSLELWIKLSKELFQKRL